MNAYADLVYDRYAHRHCGVPDPGYRRCVTVTLLTKERVSNGGSSL